MNKKGTLIPPLTLIFTIIAMGVALHYFLEANDNQEDYIGEMQLDMINLFSIAENNLIYDEQVLKQSFGDSLVDFADSGGFFNGKETSDGYTYWVFGEVSCYPTLDSLETNLGSYLTENLDFKGDYETDFIFVEGGMSVVLDPVKKYSIGDNNYAVNYTPSSNILVDYDYNIGGLLEVISSVQLVAYLCGDDVVCWEREASFPFVVDNHNKVYKFDITSGNMTDAFGEKEVILRAAVDFNELNPVVDGEFKCLV
jgi:hypothetical protein